MRFIFFKGLENVSVCRVFVCTCARGCGILKFCLKGRSAGVPLCPWAVQPRRWRGGSACDRGPAGRLASPAHPTLGNSLTSARVISREGTAVAGCCSCVCGTETHPGLLRQLWLCGCTHWHSQGPSPAGRATQASLQCSQTAQRGLLCLVCVTEGWSKRLGWEMLYLLLKKIISSMHSAAWAGSKVTVHLSLPWASLRTRASCFFPACSDCMMCLPRWPEQPSLKNPLN